MKIDYSKLQTEEMCKLVFLFFLNSLHFYSKILDSVSARTVPLTIFTM